MIGPLGFQFVVMAGLDPAIQPVATASEWGNVGWMPGTSPGMTNLMRTDTQQLCLPLQVKPGMLP
jgi:hypothetical protein